MTSKRRKERKVISANSGGNTNFIPNGENDGAVQNKNREKQNCYLMWLGLVHTIPNSHFNYTSVILLISVGLLLIHTGRDSGP